MEEKSSVLVEFCLLGDDLDLNELTENLGIVPSEKWKKGDKGKYISFYKYDNWKLSTGYINAETVDEVIEVIYERIGPKERELAKIAREKKISAIFQITIIIENGFCPGLFLNKKIIKFAKNINAEFDIDIYANPYEIEIENCGSQSAP